MGSPGLALRHVFGPRGLAPPPDQPPDSGQIEDADPEPVEHPVIRAAGEARPVDHVAVDHAEPLAGDERRHEAVERVEIGQREIDLAAEHLETAAGVAGGILQDLSAHAVGDARLELLPGAFPANPLALRQADARAACRT